MKTKKILALLLAAVMMLAAFTACGAKKEADNGTGAGTDVSTPADEGEGADTSTDTPAKTELVMGTNAAFPPYEFYGDDGKVTGIDAEIAAKIAEKLGMELTIKDMEFDSLITAVQGGSIDIAVAGMTVTDERLLSVDFSDSYATGIQVIIVPEGSDIASLDDLAEKTIGVQSGTTGDIYCTDEFGQDYVKQFNNGALAVAALNNGQVDCVVIDNEPAKAFVAANTGLKILDTEYAVEDYAIAIAKENTELKDQINTAMAELKADGTIDAIIGKYIVAE